MAPIESAGRGTQSRRRRSVRPAASRAVRLSSVKMCAPWNPLLRSIPVYC